MADLNKAIVDLQIKQDYLHNNSIAAISAKSDLINGEISELISALSELNQIARKNPEDELDFSDIPSLKRMHAMYEQIREEKPFGFWDVENPIPEDLSAVDPKQLDKMIHNLEQMRTVKQGDLSKFPMQMQELTHLYTILTDLKRDIAKKLVEALDRIIRRSVSGG